LKLSLLEATRSTELEWASRKVLESGIPEETELSFHSNGTERRFKVSITPFSSEKHLSFGTANGSAASPGIVIVMDDLTRITRLEQIRKDFVANVSHELRTPVQLIKGFSETVLDLPLVSAQEEETAALRHYIEIIRKNADVMENLIGDLLSLASLEDESGIRTDREELFLAPLFAEASALVELQAKKNNTVIVTECPPELKSKLYGTFIIQALVNLLDNAIKYSPEASQVFARAFQKENFTVLEVQDWGIGIPGEHQERIFERFYRVDKARSKEAGGTGLGLSIVRHIALLHGGKTELDSHAGKGSVFRLIIPNN
jgi:two-component system phosphate regulon sensor histidine kinase PhoR